MSAPATCNSRYLPHGYVLHRVRRRATHVWQIGRSAPYTTLLGSGDVNSTPADRSFPGEDALWVTFLEQVAVLHQCLVESDGRVHYMGAVTMHDNWLSRHRLLSGEHSVLPETDDDGPPAP